MDIHMVTASTAVTIGGVIIVAVMLRGLYVMTHQPHDGTTETEAREQLDRIKDALPFR